MNINRHNYETFFLLYVDNELSAVERRAVELFVQENTDLETELQLLVETTLPAEPISFNAKALLYKNEIDRDTLQENLLLHLDNELDPAASKKMEESIASDNLLLNEWNLLQQTKLDANEKIVFTDKQSLYRHERDRVISIRFWRIAAAAAILFACLFTVISLLKKDGTVEDIAAKKTIKPSSEKQADHDQLSNNNIVDSLQTSVPENTASVNSKEQNTTTSTPAYKINKVQNKKESGSNNSLVKEEKNILQKPSLDNINKEESNKAIASAVINKNSETISTNKLPVETVSKSVKEKIAAPEAPVIDYNSIPEQSNSYARTAMLEESTAGNSNKILYMNEENVARSKLGGLFRKVKRVIERNTNIKTGNGVKIAGFEIAVK